VAGGNMNSAAGAGEKLSTRMASPVGPGAGTSTAIRSTFALSMRSMGIAENAPSMPSAITRRLN